MKTKIIPVTLAVLVVALCAFYFKTHSALHTANSQAVTGESRPTSPSTPVNQSYQFTQTYIDPVYHFSFKYPEGFTVSAVPPAEGQGETVLVESPDNSVGVQIVISSYGSNADITADTIRQDIPSLAITGQQVLEVGSTGKGLAFMSNNPAFGDTSREVWFVFNKNLYQISTYAAYDAFLKGLFGTWQFKL